MITGLRTILSLFLLGCSLGFSALSLAAEVPAPASQAQQAAPEQPVSDRLPSYNHFAYRFNRQLDNILIEPLAEIYVNLTPSLIRTGITHFFSNLNDIPTVINGLLQGKMKQATQDTGRLLFNTTVGIGGLFDPAASVGLEKHDEDFGSTLAHWGWKESSYFVIPILGPSTVRDAIAFIPNYFMTVWPYAFHTIAHKYSYSAAGLDYLDQRANLLKAEPALNTASLDPYVALRDAYLQKRAAEIQGELGTGADGDTYVQ